MDYSDFLAGKRVVAPSRGFEADASAMPAALFAWQARIVAWACRRGRAALLTECGTGKTGMQVSWADQVCRHTGGDVLILAPLAVATQTVREAAKFGIRVTLCKSRADVRPGINVTNYDRLGDFDAAAFVGVVLDESGILKAYTGATKRALVVAFGATRYRLCCTATPAPNDHVELGNHSEFLGVMPSSEMLSRWFINDTNHTGNYRLKGHAAADFWAWVASWAVALRRPSDLGYPDDGFVLPPLAMRQVAVRVDMTDPTGERLFRVPELNATKIHQEMRLTASARVRAAADLVNGNDEPWIVWCHTNDEADRLVRAIPDAVEVRGSESAAIKEAAAEWFTGHRCICTDSLFRGKLATWQRGEKATGQTTTPNTASSASPNPSNISARTANSDANTCVNGMRKTGSASENTGEPLPNGATRNGESSTLATRNDKRRRVRTSRSGSAPTPKNDCPNDSSPTASPLSNTEPSLSSREAAVPSADSRTTAKGFTSTTATSPEGSEVCSAIPAISDSESSATTQDDLSVQPCTCGMLSGRRVLISKPAIFGWGLNFQHCANVVFVGMSYSFEELYQAVRRSWRYGQQRPVNVHLIVAETEGEILATVQKKMLAHEAMLDALVTSTRQAQGQADLRLAPYEPTVPMRVPGWLRSVV